MKPSTLGMGALDRGHGRLTILNDAEDRNHQELATDMKDVVDHPAQIRTRQAMQVLDKIL